MLLFLKSSKFVTRIVRFYNPRNAVHSYKSVFPTNWEYAFAHNVSLRNNYSTAIDTNEQPDLFEKLILQLDLDARYKHIVYLKDVENLLDTIIKRGSITFPQSLLLLKCCGKVALLEKPNVRLKLASKIWSALEFLEAKFDVLHYNTLLAVYLDNNHVFSPEEFLNDLKVKDIPPDIVTYQRLVRAHCLNGDFAGISAMLEEMKGADFPINEDIFNSLILGHCLKKDYESAFSVMDLMNQKGVPPSSETYRHILCCFAKEGNISEIRKIFEECETKDIVLLDRDLLEVVYELALSNHTEHVDEVMSMISRSISFTSNMYFVISKLLHVKLDDVALKICFLEDHQNKKINAFKYKLLLKHVVHCRSPKEIVEFCNFLKEKEATHFGISHALRELYLTKNVDKSLKFLEEAQNANIPIYSHFFWPFLMRASELGNKAMLQVTNKMNKLNVPRCSNTIINFVIPHYKFSEDWSKDLDALNYNGVSHLNCTWYAMIEYLKKGNIEAVKGIAASKLIAVKSLKYLYLLTDSLNSARLNEEDFVYIIYHLLHAIPRVEQLKMKKREEEENEAEDLENNTITINTFLEHVMTLLSKIENEQVVVRVLQVMLEKGFCIPVGAAAPILKTFENEVVKTLIEKLTDPNKNFKFNEIILKRKNPKINRLKQHIRFALSKKNWRLASEIWERNKIHMNDNDAIEIMKYCIMLNDVQTAMKICHNFINDSSNVGDFEETSASYFGFLRLLAQTGDVDNVRKAFLKGVKKGFLTRRVYSPIILAHLASNNVDEAVKEFCKNVKKWNSVSGLYEIIKVLMQNKNIEGLQTVVDVIVKTKGRRVGLCLLIFELASLEQDKHIKKLFDAFGSEMPREFFLHSCNRHFKLNSTATFECLLTATKGIGVVDRSLLYDYLLQLYVKKRDMDKVRYLCERVQEENFPLEQSVLEKFSKYMIKKSPELAESSTVNKAIVENVRALAKEGDVENLVKLIKENNFMKLNKEVCYILINDGNYKGHLEFLKLMMDIKPLIGVDCFIFKKEDNFFEENENIFYEYKQLAVDFFVNHRIQHPLIEVWFMALNFTKFVKSAENIFFNYLEKTPYAKDLSKNLSSLSNVQLENLLSNEKLRKLEIFEPGVLYSTAIENCIESEKIDEAVSYLDQAVSEKFGFFLKTDVLFLLDKALKEMGEEFPYPDLLTQNQIKPSRKPRNFMEGRISNESNIG